MEAQESQRVAEEEELARTERDARENALRARLVREKNGQAGPVPREVDPATEVLPFAEAAAPVALANLFATPSTSTSPPTPATDAEPPPTYPAPISPPLVSSSLSTDPAFLSVPVRFFNHSPDKKFCPSIGAPALYLVLRPATPSSPLSLVLSTLLNGSTVRLGLVGNMTHIVRLWVRCFPFSLASFTC